MLDQIAVADIRVVRMVQKIRDLVQRHFEPCPARGFDVRTKVVQQRFNLAPMDVRPGRVTENGAEQMGMFVAHGNPLIQVSPSILRRYRLICLQHSAAKLA